MALNICSIVLLGHFNPAILDLSWFERYRILPYQEIQELQGRKQEKKEFLSEDGMKLEMSTGRVFQVNHERALLPFTDLMIDCSFDKFVCQTDSEDNFNKVKNTVYKIFSLLEHTLINSFGINFKGHISLTEDSEQYLLRLFGQNTIFSNIFSDNYQLGGYIKSNEGDASLTVTIDKSNQLENGIFLSYNFHRERNQSKALDIVDEIESKFSEDNQKAEYITNALTEN